MEFFSFASYIIPDIGDGANHLTQNTGDRYYDFEVTIPIVPKNKFSKIIIHSFYFINLEIVCGDRALPPLILYLFICNM